MSRPTEVFRLPVPRWPGDGAGEPPARTGDTAVDAHIASLHDELARVVRERDELRRRHALLEDAPELVFGVGLDRKIFAAEGDGEGVLGYPVSELVGKSPIEFCHPDDVEPGVARYREALENPGRTVSSFSRFLRKDGRMVWVLRTFNAIRKGDEVLGVRVYARSLELPTGCDCGANPDAKCCKDGNADIIPSLIDAVQIASARLHNPELAARFAELAQAMRRLCASRPPAS